MPRKTEPKTRVRIRKIGTSFLRLVCADHTDMAMVKLLAISTMVLKKPRFKSSMLPPTPKAVGNAWRLMVYARNTPPKNKISVTRKTHMPSEAVSFCCSSVRYCPNNSPVRCTRCSCSLSLATPALQPVNKTGESVVAVRGRRLLRYRSEQTQLRPMLEIVNLPVDYRRFMEILGERR